eukprot:scaffold32486_cov66-Cyclotella_meneghiniana.AAC.7
MAAARRCSHRGSWKVDFPASGVGHWMECSLWEAMAVWGAMVVSAVVVSAVVVSLLVAVGNTEPRAKYREKTSSFSTPNRGGFARYLLAGFFADVS